MGQALQLGIMAPHGACQCCHLHHLGGTQAEVQGSKRRIFPAFSQPRLFFSPRFKLCVSGLKVSGLIALCSQGQGAEVVDGIAETKRNHHSQSRISKTGGENCPKCSV